MCPGLCYPDHGYGQGSRLWPGVTAMARDHGDGQGAGLWLEIMAMARDHGDGQGSAMAKEMMVTPGNDYSRK